MKVTLDLSKLLEDGKITREEHDRLAALGATGTGSLAFNILIAFGVVAVAADVIVLVPNAATGIVIGGCLLAGGLALYSADLKQWEVLANILRTGRRPGAWRRRYRAERCVDRGLPADCRRLCRDRRHRQQRPAGEPQRAGIFLRHRRPHWLSTCDLLPRY